MVGARDVRLIGSRLPSARASPYSAFRAAVAVHVEPGGCGRQSEEEEERA
jgi:hypothetical protein